jgi:hypothetical protein
MWPDMEAVLMIERSPAAASPAGRLRGQEYAGQMTFTSLLHAPGHSSAGS